MLVRMVALVSTIFFGSSYMMAHALESSGPADAVSSEIEAACKASKDVCYAACNRPGANGEAAQLACVDGCYSSYSACMGSIYDIMLRPPPQKSAADIRTGGGLCLDVHAPEIGANGGRVQAWACNATPQQSWTYDPASRAVRVSSGLCLDVHAGINQNGNRVQVWSCNGQSQQQWTPLKNGSLRNTGGLCLDVHAPDQTRNGARVQVWQCNGSLQQRFTSSAF